MLLHTWKAATWLNFSLFLTTFAFVSPAMLPGCHGPRIRLRLMCCLKNKCLGSWVLHHPCTCVQCSTWTVYFWTHQTGWLLDARRGCFQFAASYATHIRQAANTAQRLQEFWLPLILQEPSLSWNSLSPQQPCWVDQKLPKWLTWEQAGQQED